MNNDKIRAQWVQDDEGSSERFKYLFSQFNKKLQSVLLNCKRFIISNLNLIRNYLRFVDWRKLSKDGLIWFVEAFIEGVTANFATYYLFNVPFSFAMILAHGIIINQSISIYQRLRENTNGATAKIPEDHKH